MKKLNGSPETLRLAVAQPQIDPLAPEEDRVGQAVSLADEAASLDAELLVFPEGYPGPLRKEATYDAEASIADSARRNELAICWSRIEAGDDGGWYKVAYVTGSDGRRLMRYERAHPATGDVHPVLSGTHLKPGDDFGTAEVNGICVGVLICSELWLPEVARVLTLRGAEVLLAPAGGSFHRVAPNWQLIARARAIENQSFVALTQQLFGDEQGAALIAGPEAVLAASASPGVIAADLDLARSRWLRSADDSMAEPKQFSSLPGLLRGRRPNLYGEISAPRDGLYNYADPPPVGDELPSQKPDSGDRR